MADDGIDMEAFSLLAHEIRLGILQAFFEQWTTLDPDSLEDAKAERSLSYSELMDAVGMRDSGKFNYHLEQLRGVYVEKVDEEYIPTASAIAFYQTMLANRPTTMAEQSELELDAACPHCGGSVRGRYEQESLSIDCADCDEWWGLSYTFPKNGLRERDGNDVLEALEKRAMYHIGLARTGQCPKCAGNVVSTIPRDRLDGERTPTVEMNCDTCSWMVTIDVLNALQFDPQVAAGLRDMGLDLDDEYDTEDLVPDLTGELTATDPARVTITVRTDEATGTIVIDDSLDVLSVGMNT